MHELTVCWGFVGTTLGATAAWVYFLRDRGFAFLSYAMFFPALFAALFSLALEDGTIDLLRRLANVDQEVLLYCAAGLGGEAATIFGSAAAGMLLGWARKSSGRKGGEVHPHNRELAQAFLRAAGEELGWRSFMVPLLLRHYSPVATCAISGIVWGVYHIPIMVLLSARLRPERPLATVAVQMASCALHAFPYAFVAHRTGFALLPPALMHFFWNRLNPWLLGSIYTQTPGLLEGPQWLINGEGMSGCLAGLAVAAGVILWF